MSVSKCISVIGSGIVGMLVARRIGHLIGIGINKIMKKHDHIAQCTCESYRTSEPCRCAPKYIYYLRKISGLHLTTNIRIVRKTLKKEIPEFGTIVGFCTGIYLNYSGTKNTLSDCMIYSSFIAFLIQSLVNMSTNNIDNHHNYKLIFYTIFGCIIGCSYYGSALLYKKILQYIMVIFNNLFRDTLVRNNNSIIL
jgi:hypothetical protein